ncbi:nucleotidyltransferase family protein [Marinihelvus fidelis]|nr:nucleotidyltransferase family protein [Marinihelvus fidelis]
MVELHAILLAAGRSSRLGRPKQLLDFHGTPLVRYMAENLLATTDRVSVVTGAKRAEVELALDGLAVKLVHNDHWHDGVGTSIALAVDKLPATARGVLIMLCDQYRLEREPLAAFVARWRQDPQKILVARWPGAFGSPAIFPAALFTRLARLEGDKGARQLLLQYRSHVTFQDWPEAAHDLDDAQSLAAFRLYQQAPGAE